MLAALMLLAAAPFSISGYVVESPAVSQLCLLDEKSGYYLIKTVDCDFSHVSLILTRDRRVVKDYAYVPAQPGKLSLVTGTGEVIGMGRNELLSRRGKPLRTATIKNFWCAVYRKKTKTDQWLTTYIFKDNRLIEISIDYDRIPGCGELGGRSLEGWPHSHF